MYGFSVHKSHTCEACCNSIMIISSVGRKYRLRRALFRYVLSFALILFVIIVLQQWVRGFEKTNLTGSRLPQPNKKILKGTHLLYNLQLDDAEEVFREVIAEFPEKPVGYFYLAMVTWSRMVAGFWSYDTVDEYKKRIDRTVRVAKTRVKNNTADSYDYFYLGGALGFQGRFNMMRGKWFSSFLIAKKAIKALKTCIKMDPDNRDVLLGLGTFDYYTARLSGALKFLSYFLLHKGDTREGLRKLHIAAEEAIYSGTEAKSVLLHIYLFLEEDCSRALPLARELGKKYDKDPAYKLFEGVACVRLGLESEYSDALSYIRQRGLQSFSTNTKLLWHSRAIYLESIHDLFHARYPEARLKLKEILKYSDPENDPAMIAWPIVKIGMTYDLEGNRKEAKKYYRQILEMENGSGAQFMAERCLDKPPKEKAPIIGY